MNKSFKLFQTTFVVIALGRLSVKCEKGRKQIRLHFSILGVAEQTFPSPNDQSEIWRRKHANWPQKSAARTVLQMKRLRKTYQFSCP